MAFGRGTRGMSSILSERLKSLSLAQIIRRKLHHLLRIAIGSRKFFKTVSFALETDRNFVPRKTRRKKKNAIITLAERTNHKRKIER